MRPRSNYSTSKHNDRTAHKPSRHLVRDRGRVPGRGGGRCSPRPLKNTTSGKKIPHHPVAKPCLIETASCNAGTFEEFRLRRKIYLGCRKTAAAVQTAAAVEGISGVTATVLCSELVFVCAQQETKLTTAFSRPFTNQTHIVETSSCPLGKPFSLFPLFIFRHPRRFKPATHRTGTLKPPTGTVHSYQVHTILQILRTPDR